MHTHTVRSYLEWIGQATPPYPPLPAKAGALPPLDPAYADDVAYVRSLRRGAYTSLVKGRPAALTPQARRGEALGRGEGRRGSGSARLLCVHAQLSALHI